MLLLDTQVVLWLAREPEKISGTVARELRKARVAGQAARISVFTLWEIAMLEAEKRLALEPSPEAFLERVEAVYTVVPLDRSIAVRSQKFSSNYPKDPADRIIGATALVHHMRLVTADESIRDSGEVPCVW